MFLDARDVPAQTVLRAQVCIVGAGMAGIALALDMERHGIDTVVLESGGFDPDEATRDLSRGINAGLPYEFADGHRSRAFGGSSDIWGGWCRTMAPREFETRAWVPDGGWPFGASALAPFHGAVHEMLELDPAGYDMASWVARINRADVRRLDFATGNLTDELIQLSPPVRMGVKFRDALRQARHVKVYRHANVTDIETSRPAHTVHRLQVQALSGRRFQVEADAFILATGGIENARLLLNSDRIQPGGLGNGHDLVGRYFMDHPGISIGTARHRNRRYHNKLYDQKFHSHNPAVGADGTCVCGYLAVTPQMKAREGLLDGFASLVSVFPGEGTATEEALMQLYRALRMKEQHDLHLGRAVGTVLKDPLTTAAFAAAWLWQPPGLVTHQRIVLGIEQAPRADSRVMLSDQRDALGMRRVRVDWQLGDLERHTFDRTSTLVADELRAQGYEVTLEAPLTARGWPDDLASTKHHVGTTRMHASDRKGVVDPDCRVHGINNLFIAGSSVMPTASAHVPTVTLMALALRLGSHVRGQLGAVPRLSEAAVAQSRPVEDAVPA